MRLVSYLSCMQCKADLAKEGVKRSRCGACHSVFYDNARCQKKDWALHRHECKEQQHLFLTAAKTNIGLAVFWAQQWLKGDDPDAMTILGACYVEGTVPNKSREGAKLLLRSCKTGKGAMLGLAQFWLGKCYFGGIGVKVHRQEAVKWVRLAAEGGFADAECRLGDMYLYGEDVRCDYATALKWYRKSAEQGNAKGQTQLGLALLQPFGPLPPQDAPECKEALVWFRKAADQGFAPAQCCIANSYMHGAGIAKDVTQAMSWFRKSADRGYMTAQYELALCYVYGDGVTKDLKEAHRLMCLAAAQGMDAAIRALNNWASVNDWDPPNPV
eukprot:TRINITY_DN1031_c0_g3_i1.p1 TRINITY_DN1031_c0_g3~~TRINITY_DN1031_c0_g3_i1.p1  ORF type:complete len:328 (-),score=49.45 TRINITY_DN1031_c0_g3_i1:353-1336(-)